MDYALLIHASEARFATQTPGDQAAIFGAYMQYTKEIAATGKSQPGAALMPTSTATCLRVRNGKVTLSDGPFAETKEQLGGFYVFSTSEPEEALAWAAKIPDAHGGSIEVRPTPTFAGAPPYPPTAAKPADAAQEYLLLIYEDETLWTRMTEAERNATFGRYFGVSAEMRKAGVFIDGSALSSVREAKTVRMRDGKRLVSDGPFAETKEQLGGYYRIWARDLDHAASFAKLIPAAETGTIEIRPVMDTSQPPA
jgi:hypothetical protein